MLTFLALAATGWLLASCGGGDREGSGPGTADGASVALAPGDRNPTPEELGTLPEATVPLEPATDVQAPKETRAPDAEIEPSSLACTLAAGESYAETVTVLDLPDLPPKGDVMIAMDLTGSMGGELANVKVNSNNIMNAVRTVIPDSAFGVISFMDYPYTYSSCGYYATYGTSSYGDYAYRLNRSLTTNTALVQSALASLMLGSGWDMPEDYTRILYESYSDSNVGWRDKSARVLLLWQDDVPHDCTFRLNCGGSGSTGKDPGRDAVVGTADDLDLATVLTGVKSAGITTIALHSGSSLSLWQCYMAKAGGAAFQINYDGSIPGGTDIATFIVNKIREQVGVIDLVTLQVVEEEFEEWLTGCMPTGFSNVDPANMPEGGLPFDTTLTVPEGTEDGVYEFHLGVMGDGVEYGRIPVSITVVNEIEVPVDIKPGSCPNPLNVGSKGVVPVAICGTADVPIEQIDPASVRLCGVPPLRWSFEDVATPWEPYVDKPLDPASCHELGGDGLMDLSLKFDALEVAVALGAVTDREVRALSLTGALKPEYDGTDIVGEDVVILLVK